MRRLFASVLRSLGRLSRPVLIAICLGLVAAVTLANFLTRLDVQFSFFFLVPIGLAAWFVGRGAGLLLSIISAAAWLGESVLEGSLSGRAAVVAYANAALLLGFFLLLSTLLSTLRDALGREMGAARIDPLTGISNRRAFFELAEMEMRRVARYGAPFTVAFMDLDNFKFVNDRDGHDAGDRVLILTAETLRRGLRVNDIVARLGGDEFIVLLAHTGARDADGVLKKLETQLAAVMRQGGWPVTVSIGAATFEKPPESVEQMVKLVDQLMYSAKTSGKNRLKKLVV